jgi:hypothetical protein
MLIYDDINSLREVRCSHSKENRRSRNNAMIILYHYDTPPKKRALIGNVLKEFDLLMLIALK